VVVWSGFVGAFDAWINSISRHLQLGCTILFTGWTTHGKARGMSRRNV